MWKRELVKILFSNDVNNIDTDKAMKIKYNHFPQSLYQYRSFDDKGYSINALETDKIFLSNPHQFNDPYDCSFNLISEYRITNEDVLNVINNDPTGFKKEFKLSNKQLSKLKRSKDTIRDLAKFMAKNEYPDDKNPQTRSEYIANIEKDIRKITLDLTELKDNLRVTCFSEDNKSILMWSHYANHHTGFCVEYDFKSLGNDNHLTRNLFPVIYTNDIFSIDEYLKSSTKGFGNVMSDYLTGIDPNDILSGLELPGSDERFNNMLTIYAGVNKFQGWEYEKEWRYVFPLEKRITEVHINVPKPTAIYLGAMISEKNKEIILKIGAERNIGIYQMQMKSSEFALKADIIQ